MAKPNSENCWPKSAAEGGNGLRSQRYGPPACDRLDNPVGQDFTNPAVAVVGEVDGSVTPDGDPSLVAHVDLGACRWTSIPREPTLAIASDHLELAGWQTPENLVSPAVHDQEVAVGRDR